MAERINIMTPRGEAFFPSLAQTESFQGKDTGKYVIKVIFEGSALEEMKAMIDAYTKTYLSPAQASKLESPWKQTKDGKPFVRFWTNATTKQGLPRTVVCKDASGAVIPKAIVAQIGTGSVVRVAATLTANDRGGLSFYLDSVQVIRLSRYDAGAKFDAVDDPDAFRVDEFSAEAGDHRADEEANASPDF